MFCHKNKKDAYEWNLQLILVLEKREYLGLTRKKKKGTTRYKAIFYNNSSRMNSHTNFKTDLFAYLQNYTETMRL